jgi:adenine-specific DNA-methyltransferase
MQSPNLVDANIDKIADLFPNCITEDRDENGILHRVVDFDLLRQELSANLVEGPQERYTLSWPGKNEAILTGAVFPVSWFQRIYFHLLSP